MDVGAWIGAAVGVTVLVAFSGRVLAFFVRLERLFGPDEDGQSLRDRVRAVEKAFNNGIRSDVREARDEASASRREAATASRLAGDAARAAATAEQRSLDAIRAANAVRAELNTLVDVALADMTDIWATLADAGLDRRGKGRPPRVAAREPSSPAAPGG